MRMCLSLYEEKSLFFDARQFRHGCAQGVAACCFQKNYTARMERAQIGGFEQMSVFSLHRRLCRNRAFWFLLLLILSFFILSSCSSDDTGDKDGISIVCANFAGYDFTKEVVGRDNENIEVIFLSSGSVHSFEPSFRDIADIRSCDMFVYVGGESDAAIDTLLSSMEGVNVFRMTECVELLLEHAEHSVPGEEHDHAYDNDEEEYDEHVWTSLFNAVLISKAICERICLIDPENADIYRENTRVYADKLMELDACFADLFESVGDKPLVFGDRFPLRYFADRYSLEYYAAMSGCSHSSEPSVKTVVQLIDTVRKEDVKAVFYIESGTHDVAERIAANTGTTAALFNSCHKISDRQIEDGATYLSVMYENLETLRNVLT